MSAPVCPYCLMLSVLVGGDVIYPHRPDLFQKRFYYCRKCDAWVGCHNGTDVPLGRLANKELRTWKMKAHSAFDPLWKEKKMNRNDAYKLLQRIMAMSQDEAHIGLFSVEQCQLLIQKISELKTPKLPL